MAATLYGLQDDQQGVGTVKEDFEQREIDYVRGKIAGNDVQDNDGNTIVRKGDMITDELIDLACEKGQLHYLMIAAASSVVGAGSEETRRRLREFKDITEGHEIDFVRDRLAGAEVRDMSGHVLVHQGDRITDEVIEDAQRDGMLQELVLAVGAPGVDVDEED
jgi:hypothetical protein